MSNPPFRTSKKCELHIAVFGDVHVGHPNTPTMWILNNLRAAFPDAPATGDIDLFIIEGDFFDRLLNLAQDHLYDIRIWITQFLRMCKSRDIVVRVLEGTPSHDWKQSRLFTHLNEISEIGADVKYVPNLSIEHIERFGITVLYVPDEWNVRCDDTWLEVVALLKQHGLEKVDYAVMHGAFPHQMPKNVHHKLELHDPDRYLSIVRKYIFIGHVHLHSRYDRILAAGSFDRTAHGEEGPKGHIRVIARESGEDTVQFVVNENAQIYKTINVVGASADELLVLVESAVSKLAEGSHVRLRARKSDPGMVTLDFFRDKYPNFTWTVVEDGGSSVEDKPVLVDTREHFRGINITKENIVSLVLERVKVKHPDLHDRCEGLLKGVVHGQ